MVPDASCRHRDAAAEAEADRAAALADANRALVPFLVARLFAGRRTCDREDLEAAGYLALCEAARRFDPAQGVPFGTYAAVCVRGALYRAHREQQAGGFAAASAAMQKGTAAPSDLPRCVSLEAPVLASGKGEPEPTPLRELLADRAAPTPETAALSRAASALLWGDVARLLSPREAAVIALYYGGPEGDGEGLTLLEIGARLGVTKQRAHKMLGTALASLRRHADRATAAGGTSAPAWCC